MINEVGLVVGSAGVSHNGIFRGKDLGTITSLNEYIAFRTAHGINDNTYKDLFLGDYFKIQDGTYNVNWMVAHFDYYYAKGNGNTVATIGPKGVVLIPVQTCGESKMNDTNTTEGGYKATLINNTTCPAIASALQRVLGSYLLSFYTSISTALNPNFPSMCGAGANGAASASEWVTTRCMLPSEVQIYGSTVLSSSYYDVGEACEKLAVFNYISNSILNDPSYRSSYWLRSIASAATFSCSQHTGIAIYSGSASSLRLRPLIYIG